MASVAGTLVTSEESGSLIVAAAGEWLVATAAELDRRLRSLKLPAGQRVILDLAGIDRLDTAGAWLLLRTEHDLESRGNEVEIRNLQSNLAPPLDRVGAGGLIAPARPPRPAPHPIPGFLPRTGDVSPGCFGPACNLLP